MAQWLDFKERPSKSGKTWIFDVITTAEPYHKLGEIKWFGAWRRYTFMPMAETVFEPTCLRDIANFCDEKTLDQRRKPKNNGKN